MNSLHMHLQLLEQIRFGKTGRSCVRRLRDRFQVKALIDLTSPSHFLRDTNLKSSLSFPQFYLRRRIEKGLGAIDEYHYTLFAATRGPATIKTSTRMHSGPCWLPVFGDGLTEDFASLLPRLTSRYQYYQGDREKMAEFLYRELNVPPEALDWVRELASDEVVGGEITEVKRTPAMQVVQVGVLAGATSGVDV